MKKKVLIFQKSRKMFKVDEAKNELEWKILNRLNDILKEKHQLQQQSAILLLENAQRINVENLKLQQIKSYRLKRIG
jgi:hypothetical protein